MNRQARVAVAVWSAAAAGACAVAIAARPGGGLRTGPAVAFVAFTLMLAASWTFPMLVLRKEETEAFQLDEAFFVAMAVLLPTTGTLIAFAIAAVVSQILRRRPLSRIAFNAGQTVAAAGVGLLVAEVVAGDAAGTEPWNVLSVVVGAAAFLAVSALSVSAVVALAENEPFRSVLLDGARFRLLVWVAGVALGIMVALSASTASWALLLAVVPMTTLQHVLAGSLRARRDRDRLEGLFRTALDTHGSTHVADVERALADSATRLLACRGIRFDASPPGDGELGSRLPGDVERWMILSDRRGVEEFGPQDARLLDTIVAVGSSALENARLVEQLTHQAFHDGLTSLPNLTLLEERLTYALALEPRTGEGLAVALLDLDQFKKVNDSLGHAAGNQLLQQVAERLTTSMRAGDTVARMGGDEFTLLLPGVAGRNEAAEIGRKLRDAFRRPFWVEGHEMFISASVGIALYPAGGRTPQDLIKNADVAMYRSKQRGRNACTVYTPDLNADAERHLRLEADLYKAVETGSLRLVYQPQVDVASGAVVGFEALIRWRHTTLGDIPPDEFIPLAEETGLIVEVDEWVLRSACAQGQRWVAAGLKPVRMSVNLSAVEAQRDRLVASVAGALADSGLEARLLELEVTERVASSQTGELAGVFQQLRARGVRVAIDDFGTGYSSLARLRDLPCDKLKIDRSFVMEIARAHEESPMVGAMIAMAHGLGLEVVAEGVETTEQLAFLARKGCDVAQGYLVGKPLEARDATALLSEPRSRSAVTA